MKNALLRGIVIFGLGFGLVALSACADQNEVDPPTTEEPIIDGSDVIEEEPMIDDSTMADSTMMEEEHAEGDGDSAGFDVTGLWTEQGGGSTLYFTETGGHSVHFDPQLSDGTTDFSGDSYNRVDNSHLTFTILVNRFDLIEVEATINDSNVLRFELEGKTYRFIKTP